MVGLMVVIFTTDILVVIQRQLLLHCVVVCFNGDFIQSLFEDGLHAAAGG
jgi:hypothetical protein